MVDLPEPDDDALSDNEKEHLRDLADTPHEDLPDAAVTAKVHLSIKRRFSAPEWIMAFEFPSPGGKQADAIAVNTTASRNYKVVGFEFKASRGDWRKEMRDGTKSDYFLKLCDEWYVVAGRKGIVEEEELPAGWGLLELKPNSDQIWKLVESEMTERQQGGPDRWFWTRFLKKTVGDDSNFSMADIREARRRGYEEAKEDEQLDEVSKRKLERLKEKAGYWDALRDRGMDYVYRANERELERLEKAYRLVRNLDPEERASLEGSLEMLQDDVESRYRRFADDVEQLKERAVEVQEAALEGELADDE